MDAVHALAYFVSLVQQLCKELDLEICAPFDTASPDFCDLYRADLHHTGGKGP